jgi:uncharacterized RDD family membrane protein YckC
MFIMEDLHESQVQETTPDVPKADLVKRLVAAIIDGVIAGIIAYVFPVIGAAIGAVYYLVRDGLDVEIVLVITDNEGRRWGDKLAGTRVIEVAE